MAAEMPGDRAQLITKRTTVMNLLISNDLGVKDIGFTEMVKLLAVNSGDSSNAMQLDDYMILWKGLFSFMWMSEPLAQETVRVKISSLLHMCSSYKGKILFLEAFFVVINDDWMVINQNQMDAFIILMRHCLNQVLLTFVHYDWDPQYVGKFSEALYKALKTFSYSLRTHLQEIFEEELAKVSEGKVPSEALVMILDAFLQYVSELNDHVLINKVVQNILKNILSRSQKAMQKMGKPGKLYNDLESVEGDIGDDDSNPHNNIHLDSYIENESVEIPHIKFNPKDVLKILNKYITEVNCSRECLVEITKLIQWYNQLWESILPYQSNDLKLNSDVLKQKMKTNSKFNRTGFKKNYNLLLNNLKNTKHRSMRKCICKFRNFNKSSTLKGNCNLNGSWTVSDETINNANKSVTVNNDEPPLLISDGMNVKRLETSEKILSQIQKTYTSSLKSNTSSKVTRGCYENDIDSLSKNYRLSISSKSAEKRVEFRLNNEIAQDFINHTILVTNSKNPYDPCKQPVKGILKSASKTNRINPTTIASPKESNLNQSKILQSKLANVPKEKNVQKAISLSIEGSLNVSENDYLTTNASPKESNLNESNSIQSKLANVPKEKDVQEAISLSIEGSLNVSENDYLTTNASPKESNLNESNSIQSKLVDVPKENDVQEAISLSIEGSSNVSENDNLTTNASPKESNLNESNSIQSKLVDVPKENDVQEAISLSIEGSLNVSENDYLTTNASPKESNLNESNSIQSKLANVPKEKDVQEAISLSIEGSSNVSENDNLTTNASPKESNLNESNSIQSKLVDVPKDNDVQEAISLSIEGSLNVSENDYLTTNASPKESNLNESNSIQSKLVDVPKENDVQEAISLSIEGSSNVSENDNLTTNASPKESNLNESNSIQSKLVDVPKKNDVQEAISLSIEGSSNVSENDNLTTNASPKESNLNESNSIQSKLVGVPKKNDVQEAISLSIESSSNVSENDYPTTNTSSKESNLNESFSIQSKLVDVPKENDVQEAMSHPNLSSSLNESWSVCADNNFNLINSKSPGLTIPDEFITSNKSNIKQMNSPSVKNYSLAVKSTDVLNTYENNNRSISADKNESARKKVKKNNEPRKIKNRKSLNFISSACKNSKRPTLKHRVLRGRTILIPKDETKLQDENTRNRKRKCSSSKSNIKKNCSLAVKSTDILNTSQNNNQSVSADKNESASKKVEKNNVPRKTKNRNSLNSNSSTGKNSKRPTLKHRVLRGRTILIPKDETKLQDENTRNRKRKCSSSKSNIKKNCSLAVKSTDILNTSQNNNQSVSADKNESASKKVEKNNVPRKTKNRNSLNSISSTGKNSKRPTLKHRVLRGRTILIPKGKAKLQDENTRNGKRKLNSNKSNIKKHSLAVKSTNVLNTPQNNNRSVSADKNESASKKVKKNNEPLKTKNRNSLNFISSAGKNSKKPTLKHRVLRGRTILILRDEAKLKDENTGNRKKKLSSKKSNIKQINSPSVKNVPKEKDVQEAISLSIEGNSNVFPDENTPNRKRKFSSYKKIIITHILESI